MTIQEQVEDAAASVRQRCPGRWPWNHWFRRGVNALMLHLITVFGTSTIAVSKNAPRLIGLTLTAPEPAEHVKGLSSSSFTIRTTAFRRLRFLGQNVVQTPFGRYMVSGKGQTFTVRLKVGNAILFESKSNRPGFGRSDVEDAAAKDFDDRVKRLVADWVTFGGFDSPTRTSVACHVPDGVIPESIARSHYRALGLDETATTKKEAGEQS